MIRWVDKSLFRKDGAPMGRRRGVELLGLLFGFERSTVWLSDHGEFDKYLDRWILYVAGYTLRLHKFYRGDDVRSSHTHPWWFLTFPLGSYRERVYNRGYLLRARNVLSFRWHFRPANFEHIVMGGIDERLSPFQYPPGPLWRFHRRPFWTIVITGRRTNAWGFYDSPGIFRPFRANRGD